MIINRGFLKCGYPNHPKLTRFSIETYGFDDPPF